MAPAIPSDDVEMTPEIRAQAKAAAQRAGLSVERWLDEAVRQFARFPSGQHAPSGDDFGLPHDAPPAPRSLADLGARLEALNLGGSDTALARPGAEDWYRHADFTAREPGAASVRDGLDDDPMRVMERTIRAIVDHLEVGDRRHADALRQIQAQIQTLVQRGEHQAGPGGGEAFAQIEHRLEALAARVEEIGTARAGADVSALEQRIAGLAAAFDGQQGAPGRSAPDGDRRAAPAKAGSEDAPPARSGPGEAPAEASMSGGNDYVTAFMRRQQQRRRTFEPAGSESPAPAAAGSEAAAKHAADKTAMPEGARQETPPWRRETAALKANAEAAITAQGAALRAEVEARLKAQGAAITADMARRFEEFAHTLRAALDRPHAPPRELAELQTMVQSLGERVDGFANRPPAEPAFDDSALKATLDAFSKRLDAAEERFATLGSVDATFAKLFDRLDEAERQIRETADGPKPDRTAFDRQFKALFARLEESREAMLEAARCAAAEVAEETASRNARELAEESVRQAQAAAVTAAQEAARAYLAEDGAGAGRHDGEIVAALQSSLRQLRADVNSADARTQETITRVEDMLRAIAGRLSQVEQRAHEDPPAPRPAVAAVPAQPADRDDTRRVEPTFAEEETAGSDLSIPEPLAALRLPALDVPPLADGGEQDEADAASDAAHDSHAAMAADDAFAEAAAEAADIAFTEGTADEDKDEDAATLNRPREPGEGPPRAVLDRLAREFGQTRPGRDDTARPAPVEASGRATPAPAPAAATAASGNGGEAGKALRSARTTNELLAAARRAAQAASEQNTAQRGGRQSLRERLRIPRSPFSRDAGGAKEAGGRAARPAAPAPVKVAAGAKAAARPAKGQPAARKPIVLAVAAVIVLAGTVEIYKFVRDRAPGLLPGAAPRIEGPAGTPAPSDESRATPVAPQGRDAAAAERDALLDPSPAAPAGAQSPTGAIGDPATLAPSPNAFVRPAEGRADRAGTTDEAGRADHAEKADGSSASLPDENRSETAAATPAGDAGPGEALPPIPAALGPASLRRAALAGDAIAQFEVASRFADGRGGKADPEAALAWYRRAAASGLAPAQFRLGSMYEKGTGAARDHDKARLWYERAAAQGNRKAMHNLAVLHADGFNGQPDFESAARWFRAAAALGLADSQYNLGILHVRGLGVPQNFTEAYKWFAIVAGRGDKDAATRRDAIAAKLTPQDLAAARLAAQTWKAKPLDAAANAVRLPDAGWQAENASAEAARPDVDAIRSAQELLAALGYQAGPADGMSGPQTREAVRAFQRHGGLEPTGEVTPELIRKLRQAAG